MTSVASPPLIGPAARSSGVLLHPTSLPSPFGVGDLGPSAYAWVDALARAKQRWWQTLPLGPTGYGDSPYQSFSSFAGNPLLVSPELLRDDGLLRDGDWAGVSFPDHEVDYGAVLPYKAGLLDTAWRRFCAGSADHLRHDYLAFQNAQAGWLDAFSLFMAVKEEQGGASWQTWPTPLKRGEPDALKAARERLVEAIDRVRFRQFLFFRQWARLKAHANQRGVYLLGDTPIFVASDSADVWGRPELFLLDADRRPTFVAGVPPDYFSPVTGQLWGNPLYDWKRHAADGYAWWAARVAASLALFDFVRLDHFRGFEAAWHVPAGAETAAGGHWVSGPRDALFRALRDKLGRLPLIAEDLGEITPEVRALRDQFALPGMRILQFAWDGKPENVFLPHNYANASVAYTGSHDNDTTWGWYQEQPEWVRQNLWRYLDKPRRDDGEVVWELVRLAQGSAADFAILPLQDLLVLGPDARMNAPGRAAGNWKWRVTPQQPVESALQRLAELTVVFNRHPDREGPRQP